MAKNSTTIYLDWLILHRDKKEVAETHRIKIVDLLDFHQRLGQLQKLVCYRKT